MILPRCVAKPRTVHGLTILASADLTAVNLANRGKTMRIFADRIRKSAGQDSPADLITPRNAKNLKNSVAKILKSAARKGNLLVALPLKEDIILHRQEDIQQIRQRVANRLVVAG